VTFALCVSRVALTPRSSVLKSDTTKVLIIDLAAYALKARRAESIIELDKTCNNPEGVVQYTFRFTRNAGIFIIHLNAILMGGSYSQIYIQIVFAIEWRQNLIKPIWKDALHKYIAGIIRNKNQKPIIVNGMPDHIHAFVGMKATACVSDLVRDMKNNSTNYINTHHLLKGKFSWQEGYGAFLTPIHILHGYSIISITRKSIINIIPLKQNTFSC
jgi:putative transposase